MTSRDALKEQILTKAVVHGKVILSSGKEADYYVDLRRVTLDAVAAPLVGEVMLDLCVAGSLVYPPRHGVTQIVQRLSASETLAIAGMAAIA